MSGSSLALKPSSLRRYLLLALLLGSILVFAATPLPLIWRLVFLPLWGVFFWYWLRLWQQTVIARVLFISDDNKLHWLDGYLPAGVLCRSGVVGQYASLLCWLDEQSGKKQQVWLFYDQFSEADYRTLARCILKANHDKG